MSTQQHSNIAYTRDVILDLDIHSFVIRGLKWQCENILFIKGEMYMATYYT